MTNFLYNPDRKSKDSLIAEFVVRTKLLEDIMQDIESSDMDTPEQHYLLVGQRGTGKTTLLHRIRYAIEDNKELNKWLIPVIFSEEQYNISELANLWETVAHTLEDYHGFAGISAEMEMHITKDNFEEHCYDILEKHLQQNHKKLVLLIDNVGDILKKLEDKEVRRLREILQTKSYIRLIAGSPFYLDSILDYKQPFFEFFKVIRLEGLDKEETLELLKKLGEIYNEKEKIERIIKETPGRVETLRILTGGVPRTLALMFKIFTDHEHESSVKDLERILDLVTPLYKHRMDDLPKQQQKIVDAVAKKWEAISVKELKEKVRLESKVISAQLRQLEKNQIIEKRVTDTKNHNYLIKERFFNIWYLMRYGRKDTAESVKWLVSFMENWYDKSEMEKKVESYVEAIMENKLNSDSVEFYGNVYKAFNNLSDKAKSKLTFGLNSRENSSLVHEDMMVLKKLSEEGRNEDLLRHAVEMSFLTHPAKSIVVSAVYKILTSDDVKLKMSVVKLIEEKIEGADYEKRYGTVFIIIAMTFWGMINKLLLGKYQETNSDINVLSQIVGDIQDNFGYDFFNKYFLIEDEILQACLVALLSVNQINMVANLFESEKNIRLRDIYKPIYYATLALKNEQIGNTLGEEMKIPVQDVMNRIALIKTIVENLQKQNKNYVLQST